MRSREHLYIPPHNVPTIKILGSFHEKSKLVIHNPASAARSRMPPALRGLEFSIGLCSFIILNLKGKNILQGTETDDRMKNV